MCSEVHSSPPALSRIDNKTLVCPLYGVRQALDSSGVEPETKEKILKIVKRSYLE